MWQKHDVPAEAYQPLGSYVSSGNTTQLKSSEKSLIS